MSTVSAKEFGNKVRFTGYGEYLKANDGDGMLKGETLTAGEQDVYFATDSEVLAAARHAAAKDIEYGSVTYPPSIERTLELADDFYATYLFDSGYDRVEAKDRYVAMVIELLEQKQKEGADVRAFESEEAVRDYVESVHSQALELASV